MNYATTPQPIDTWVFQGVKKSTCTLYVPKASLNAYKTADNWKDFFNILSIEDAHTAIEETEQDPTIKSKKMFIDGQVFILQGNMTYMINGIKIK